jgi:type II secretory pathway pseudopilin PulG
MRRLRATRAQAPGYTLMELVVAAMISLLVIAGLYVVYAGHSRVFRGQEQVSQSQVTARFAMEVVRADMRRVGFMGIADSQDPQASQQLCGQPKNGRILAVQLRQGVGQVHLPAKNLAPAGDISNRPTQAPDELILVGNYANAESYWVNLVRNNAVTLQDNGTVDATEPFPQAAEEFDDLFLTSDGSRPYMARLRHQDRVHFSLVTGADYGTKRVNIADAPGCLPGLWDGAQLNVVHRIRYRVVKASLTAAEADVRDDYSDSNNYLGSRLDLVREVLDWTNDEVVRSQVVAENVVDFQVWFLFDSREAPETGPAVDLSNLDLTDDLAGTAPCDRNPGDDADCAIKNIHGAVVRLSVRTQREDPNFLMPSGVRRPLQWYEIDPRTAGAARVRTLVSLMDLPNITYGL